MHDIIKSCLEAEARAILNIPAEDTLIRAVEIFYHHVHEKGGKLVISGMGKAGQIADNIATTFSSTGTPAVFLHPSNAQHGDLGILSKNDVLLLISNSGKTREILELVDLTHNLFAEVPIIVITGNKESTLARIADITIATGNPPEVCPLGLTPTTSTTTMTVIGDILVVLLMKKINFTAADYSKRHHGGYLGTRSRDAAAGDTNIN
jgi:arabinose-5-phosphate isomerase